MLYSRCYVPPGSAAAGDAPLDRMASMPGRVQTRHVVHAAALHGLADAATVATITATSTTGLGPAATAQLLRGAAVEARSAAS